MTSKIKQGHEGMFSCFQGGVEIWLHTGARMVLTKPNTL